MVVRCRIHVFVGIGVLLSKKQAKSEKYRRYRQDFSDMTAAGRG